MPTVERLNKSKGRGEMAKKKNDSPQEFPKGPKVDWETAPVGSSQGHARPDWICRDKAGKEFVHYRGTKYFLTEDVHLISLEGHKDPSTFVAQMGWTIVKRPQNV
jgi:hypothetical protein